MFSLELRWYSLPRNGEPPWVVTAQAQSDNNNSDTKYMKELKY